MSNQPPPGKLDHVFDRQRAAVFVDGCFWHGCPIHSKPSEWLRKSSMTVRPAGIKCREPRTENREPRTGKAFWKQKLAANMARDRFVNRELRKQGWKVVRIWEHELKKGSRQLSAISYQPAVEKIRKALGNT